jgi:CarboxypepD_reg-like domain
LVSPALWAQTLKGLVLSADSSRPLRDVTVYNIATQQTTVTDDQGFFAIPASAGDVISFSLLGYTTVRKITTADMDMKVQMAVLSHQLKEFVMHSYTQFQRDSIAFAEEYSKELNTKAIKPHVGADNGLSVSGLIGAPVQKISRSYKRNKRFKEDFKSDMEQKFIDTRYTPTLVTSLTRLKGDTLVSFMNMYPMQYDFARAATDLELKMWIRNNYKEYMKMWEADTPKQTN